MHPRFSMSPAAGEIIEHLRAAARVYVATHVAPDGDSIGSSLGLYWGLGQTGKEVRLACADPVPGSFVFLPGAEVIKPVKPEPAELLAVLDTSDLRRLGSLYEPALFEGRPVLNVDHHVTNLRFGTVNWVEPSAASTAEIVVDLLNALNVQLEEPIATCLLTGIATDTLGFRTASTTPELVETAALLMRAGASLPSIIEKTFNMRDLSDLRLQGRILSGIQVENGLVWSDNTVAMRRETGAQDSGGSGSGSALLSVKGAKISVIFIEREDDQVEVSLRARPGLDISSIALRLGGGGHPQAAGCTLRSTLAAAHAQVLPLVRAALNGK